MNYFGIYNTSGDVQTALSAGTLNKPYVAIVGDEIDYDSLGGSPGPEPEPYEGKYVTVTYVDEGTGDILTRTDEWSEGTVDGSSYQDAGVIRAVIGNGITEIGEYAFCDNDETLSSVTIGSGVTAIGGQAFQNGPIAKLIIPASVQSIGMNAFNAPIGMLVFEGSTPPVLVDDSEQITLGSDYPILVPNPAAYQGEQDYDPYYNRLSDISGFYSWSGDGQGEYTLEIQNESPYVWPAAESDQRNIRVATIPHAYLNGYEGVVIVAIYKDMNDGPEQWHMIFITPDAEESEAKDELTFYYDNPSQETTGALVLSNPEAVSEANHLAVSYDGQATFTFSSENDDFTLVMEPIDVLENY